MNRSRSVKQLATAAAALPEVAAPPAEPAQAIEAVLLGRELARIAFRERAKQLPADDPRSKPLDRLVQDILAKPLCDVTFNDIETLACVDADRMQSHWDSVKAAARDELAGGWQASRAVEMREDSAWERACFDAVRQALRDTWPPRSPGEAILIDDMAQYHTLRRRWMRVLNMHSVRMHALSRQEPRGLEQEVTPSLSQAAATREAVMMIDRLQRLSERALRALLSLRRGNARTVIVRQAGQVNVAAGPQMNVNEGNPPDRGIVDVDV